MHIIALQFLCKAGWGFIYLYLFVTIYMDQTKMARYNYFNAIMYHASIHSYAFRFILQKTRGRYLV